MFDWIKKKISPLILSGIDNVHRAQLLQTSSVILFVFSLLFFCVNIISGSQAEKDSGWLLVLLACFQILVLLMIRSGHVNLAGLFLFTIAWVILTMISHNVGGIRDEAVFGYAVIIIGSSYLLGWRIAFIYTIVSVAAIWWLAYLENGGFITPNIANPQKTAIDLIGIFLLIVLIMYSINKTLTKAQDELTKLAITDPLTGLYNRRHFFELASKEFAGSNRYNRSLSVIILDIDYFKKVNDTYGHLVGDQVLAFLARVLKNTMRESDTVARYGGEEFIVLLPETNCASALRVGERLRRIIIDLEFHCKNEIIPLTVSIGVAGKENKTSYNSFDQLVLLADQALLKAKRTGRNQTIGCFTEIIKT